MNSQDTVSGGTAFCLKEQIMAFVRVEQRNAHLAGPVRLETVSGSKGPIAKAVVTAISNTRLGTGEGREDEATAIQWTLWGKQAENAAEYLGKGSHVNVIGRVRNNNYRDAEGNEVFSLAFACEEIDYLDSKAESEARKARQEGQPAAAPAVPPAAAASAASKANGRSRKAAQAQHADNDIPF